MPIGRLTWGSGSPLLVACMLTTTSLRAEPVEVKIENFEFDPPALTVKAGTEVRWKNYDDIPHSVADPAVGFNSTALDIGEAYERTFATPGIFDYICGLHPRMRGTIVVVP